MNLIGLWGRWVEYRYYFKISLENSNVTQRAKAIMGYKLRMQPVFHRVSLEETKDNWGLTLNILKCTILVIQIVCKDGPNNPFHGHMFLLDVTFLLYLSRGRICFPTYESGLPSWSALTKNVQKWCSVTSKPRFQVVYIFYSSHLRRQGCHMKILKNERSHGERGNSQTPSTSWCVL